MHLHRKRGVSFFSPRSFVFNGDESYI